MSRQYIPTIGYFSDDIKNSHKLFSMLGEGAHGLMFVARNGMQNFTGKGRNIQYDNFMSLSGYQNIPLIVMAPNMPLGDIDFYHNPESSLANLKLVIDFTTEFPAEKSSKIVTFHLNSLLWPDEWARFGANPNEKLLIFNRIFSDTIFPALVKIASYAKSQGVQLKVETTPVPEFGDIADGKLSRLGNPFPLYSGRGFSEIRKAGLGIALDFSHTFTLYKSARLFKEKGDRVFDTYRGLFPTDVDYLNQHNLIDEVKSLKDGDVVHINDSLGLYDPSQGLVHKESVALGDGEIEELPDIIKILKTNNLNIVFEINESDYVNRPNLIKSLEYFHAN